ncbi:hypothetical protein KL918_004380 [Ogataea parapolymorpha]|uniref:AAA+ ATPase domain-containing protein n=1 Tax=Ogataea parapolymorpha (strain ATCC 26012 / BCRC 20466 / JCM 22074 / NRRL Y-7560 / DL-1) TaxID=871575 RepID=W1QFA7_OGAPD|nr:hypothetical protein HPODL_00179 [Ogataea parapolymorpha DL-1]ESX00763.1 hypothetical protein HPODL_00179 [Ogataea parapolymorpha DL-1]KAG7865499.1 hypothetical protein KL918_004380 [Ogataea parapolymorpha]KAG7873627.1 hypothetical protein KL916_002231 [Ogataea parapolymorpha]
MFNVSLKTSNSKKPGASKQSTLASFITSSKPSRDTKPSQPFSALKLDKRSVSNDEDFLQNKENAYKRVKLDRSVSCVGFGQLETPVSDMSISQPSSFKHSKPIEKLEFEKTEIDVSTRQDVSIGRSIKLPVRKPVSASRQRSLPWSNLNMKKISNPRNQNKPSSQNGNSVSGSLSEEQRKVIEMVLYERKNIFYTGSAGTGKSFLLREIIKRLRNRYGSSSIAVTASTGLAATNIEGTTINRFAGTGLGSEPVNKLVSRIKSRRSIVERWKGTKVLIIDELSMIDSIFFDKLNEIAKQIRGSNKPFGGIQLVLTGDFFQLPPVSLSKMGAAKFCFDAVSWKECIDETILLTKVFRQQNDSDLIEMLNALRIGKLSDDLKRKFKRLERPLQYNDGIYPTELYPTREEVDRANLERLNSLPGRVYTFQSRDNFPPNGNPAMFIKQLDGLMCAKTLQLKEGAQIMYLKNDLEDPQLVNGSIGKIVCFCSIALWTLFTNTFKEYERPMHTDLLVMASRFTGNEPTAQDEALYNEFLATNYNSPPQVELAKEMIRTAKNSKLSEVLPLVKFSHSSLRLIEPVPFSTESNSDLSREQLPILLSWALSIHKSQGQTLERVKVDLTKIFEKGQVYVALSRCVDTKNLEIVNFDEKRIRVSEDVVQFYENLKRLK